MSLHRQVFLSALLILFGSVALGAFAIYVHAVSKVQLEMEASLAVSRQTIARGMADLNTETDPRRRLAQIISSFDGDRHVTVSLRAPSGATIARSNVRAPRDPAPAWFFRQVAIFPRDLRFAPPASLAGLGTIVLEPYPANEVAEAWSDAGLTFDILLLFFVVVLGMNMWLQRRALRPLLRLHDALADIGQGCYDTRIPDVGYVELQPVLSQFNAMAEKLARVEQQKNQLRRQLQRIQEDEGAELARDLHDEVAPFLVAVGTDAALIRHSLAAGAGDRIAGYADQIAASVTHMQRHLREILARLRHSTLAELGLRNGIEALAEFWQQRRPDIVFNLLIADIDVPEARADLAFRIVQEAVTNAIRHGNPGHVLVRIESVADALRIDIADDGQGFDMEEHRNGYGITGMIERARSAGGTLRIEKLASRGTVVRATLPDVMVGAA